MLNNYEIKKPNIFIAYSRKDEKILNDFKKHLVILERNKIVNEIWSDQKIVVGMEYEKEIWGAFENSEIIILLLSPDFIYSDFCYDKEMSRAIEKHKKRLVTLIPILIRPCNWEETPISKIQMLPKNAVPIYKYPSATGLIDDHYTEITAEIIKVIYKNWEKQDLVHVGFKKQPFLMDQSPVTNKQFANFLNSEGNKIEGNINWADITFSKYHDGECLIKKESSLYVSKKEYNDYPVTGITWSGAKAYAKWVGKKLPSVEQWEFAASGKKSWHRTIYSGSNNPNEVAWYRENAKSPMIVKKKAPNGLGIYDLCGNVWEWCLNYKIEDGIKIAYCKGGSWIDNHEKITIQAKEIFDINTRRSNIGFRCVFNLDQSE